MSEECRKAVYTLTPSCQVALTGTKELSHRRLQKTILTKLPRGDSEKRTTDIRAPERTRTLSDCLHIILTHVENGQICDDGKISAVFTPGEVLGLLTHREVSLEI